MNRRQCLSTGAEIVQDIRRAIRPMLFQTDIQGFEYATHGGTLFVVVYRGRPYGITCRHCFGDFELTDLQLVVAGSDFPKKGEQPAAIATLCMLARQGVSVSDLQTGMNDLTREAIDELANDERE